MTVTVYEGKIEKHLVYMSKRRWGVFTGIMLLIEMIIMNFIQYLFSTIVAVLKCKRLLNIQNKSNPIYSSSETNSLSKGPKNSLAVSMSASSVNCMCWPVTLLKNNPPFLSNSFKPSQSSL